MFHLISIRVCFSLAISLYFEILHVRSVAFQPTMVCLGDKMCNVICFGVVVQLSFFQERQDIAKGYN